MPPTYNQKEPPVPTVYRVRVNPKHQEIHAILIFVKCEEGPVVAGLRALQRLSDIAVTLDAEHVTSVHQCRKDEPR